MFKRKLRSPVIGCWAGFRKKDHTYFILPEKMVGRKTTISPGLGSLVKEVVTLSSVWSIIYESNFKELEASDLRPPLPWFRAVGNAGFEEDALGRWEKKQAQYRSRLARGRVGWAVVWSQMGPFRLIACIGVLLSSLQGLLGTVGRFLVLRTIIRASQNPDTPNWELTRYALMFFGIALVEGLCAVFSRQLLAGHLIHSLMARNNALLIHKVAKVSASTSTSTLNSRSAAQMPSLATLYAADMPRMLSMVKYLSLLPCGIVSLIGGVCVIAVYLGFSAVAACFCMVVVQSVQQYSTRSAKRHEIRVFEARDDVVASIKQSITAMKAVKFYAWEDQYAKAVGERRKFQESWWVKYRLHLVSATAGGKAFPIIATVVTLVFTASLNNNFELNAEDAFSALAVFHTIRLGMTIVPLSLVLCNTFINIHDRIGYFLEAPEDKDVNDKESDNEQDLAKISNLKATLGVPDDDEKTMKDDTKEEEDSKNKQFTLSIDDFKVEKGELVALVGEVGSGKTATILALLGRLEHTGLVEVYSDVVGYAPQEPFVVSGTISENIVMGRSFDAEKLERAIEIASFVRDVEMLTHGFDTVIGERGTTLSGGQQARLQVARAVYGDPKLLVLDSSLAAVDAKVARDMFDSLKKWVRSGEKTRSALLVVSQLHFLPECDSIYVLERGRMVAKGAAHSIVEDHFEAKSLEKDFLGHLVRTLKEGGGSSEVEDLSIEDDDDDDDTVETLDKKAAFMTEKTMSRLDATSQKMNNILTQRKKKTTLKGREDDENALVKKEVMKRGVVSLKVFKAWARRCGYWKLAAVVGIYYFGTFMLFGSDVILSQWTRATSHRSSWMAAYACVAMCYVPALITGAVTAVKISAAGASELHSATFDTVLHAPVAWFDSVPSGRIVSRFSADFDIVDMEWAQMGDAFITMVTAWTTFILAICIVVPLLIPINALAFYMLIRILLNIDVANRDLKRIANAAVSPCVTTAAEAETGRVVSHAIGADDFFRNRQRINMDGQLAAFFASTCIHQAAYMSATAFSSLISLATSLIIVLLPDVALSDRSVAPVALTYALVAPYFASMASEVGMQLSLFATSLERVFEYLPDEADGGGTVPKEPPHSIPETDSLLKADWPSRGLVTFEELQLRYRDGLPLALVSASFTMEPSEKVGVVGRTGAGKSSLFIALFRLVDICGGRVYVDGVDTSTLGLRVLRKRLCLIPQDAVLMQGTGKTNCDPFNEYSDDQVSKAIEKVGLPKSCLHQTLVTNDGDSTSLSAGERQLLALARCLLRRSKVVCFDEATAHVDANTDLRIQEVISQEFQDSTLLAIAHRLHTVIAYDKLVVMKDGLVAQCASPLELLADEDGLFADMCSALGPKAVQDLLDIATAAKEKKNNKIPLVDPAAKVLSEDVVIDIDDADNLTDDTTADDTQAKVTPPTKKGDL